MKFLKKPMNKIIVLILALMAVSGGGYAVNKYMKYQKEPVPTAVEISQIVQDHFLTQETLATEEEVQVPAELNLQVPFYSQAPFENWDYPWEEACEEASILLVANVYLDRNWTREEFNDEILKLVQWENDTYGSYFHTTMEQTRRMLEDNYGLTGEIHDYPTRDDIRKILAKGHLIVAPFDGKKLGNIYFRNGGPVYHVLVIKGYKQDGKVITNDVGTKRGEDYVYTWNTIEAALHDYSIPMSDGVPRILEVFPPSS